MASLIMYSLRILEKLIVLLVKKKILTKKEAEQIINQDEKVSRLVNYKQEKVLK